MSLKLSVLSYNIHKGMSALKTRSVLTKMRDALKNLDVDIVFLQEVMGHDEQFEYLAHEIWPHHVYGKNAVINEKHHGNAILSKYPILKSENVDITINRFEKRGVLHAEIIIPGLNKPLHCLNAHLNLLHRDRVKQIKATALRLNSILPSDEPIILAGDFNDWSEKLTILLKKEINVDEVFKKKVGKLHPTFPSQFPIMMLDRIYVRGFTPNRVAVLSGLPWNQLSDHLPILGEISLN